MKSAGSSKGKFLPSEVPRNRVQKLILNITTATVWQEKRCMYHNSSSTSWTRMKRWAHLPDTACIKTTQLHILLQKQDQRSGAIAGKGHVGQRRFPAGEVSMAQEQNCFSSTGFSSSRQYSTGWDLKNRFDSCCSKKSSFTARENKLLRKSFRCHCTNKIQAANNRFLSHTSFACGTRRHIL